MADSSTEIVTGKVRFSYVHLLEPWTNDPTKDPRYSVTLLIPKSDKKTLTAIKNAQKAALELGPDKCKGWNKRKKPKLTIHDGDARDDLEDNPEYEGHYYMAVSASTKYRPAVVGRDLSLITEESDIYSGCFGRVSLNAYPFVNSGNQGVSFGLNMVQKMEDGEPLGGVVRRPSDVFEALDDPDDDDEGSDDEDGFGFGDDSGGGDDEPPF